MPRSLPPAWLDLTSRSPGAAARATQNRPRALSRACNGISTHITGKLQEPWDTEPSGKEPPSRGSPCPEPPNPGGDLEGGPQNPPQSEPPPSS
ncbi:uncharacterized protein LOC131574232 [Poecile atricapillus]|uniref:uncharacterized protein LOC131574232 n=1 Tax=Poecile atricapillus TaxID=48891 RepID=UPI002739A95F|nr:uncharacterized protein LOC131574232 [Poecile atricapillus]